MKLVLDCNVLISAAWNPGLSRAVFEYALERHVVIVSPAIIAEYRRVSLYPKFAEKLPILDALIALLMNTAIIVEDRPCPVALPDPDDMAYLAAALHNDAQVIVSGNLKDFPDRPYGAVQVLSVREFATLNGVI